MGAHDRRVDHHPPQALALRLRRHELEEPLQSARADPAAKPVVDGIPRAEFRRQVAPGDAGSCPIEDGLEEHTLGGLGLGTQRRSATLDHRAEDGPDLVRDDVSHGDSGVRPGVDLDLNPYHTSAHTVNTT